MFKLLMNKFKVTDYIANINITINTKSMITKIIVIMLKQRISIVTYSQ